MSLTICTVTNASPDDLRAWIWPALAAADEVIVGVDQRADPLTLELAQELADRVFVLELDGVANPAYSWLASRATSDWVLMLDDDERLAPGFADHVRALMEDRRYTHYHLPVRWLVPHPEGGLGWIRQFPWWPNRATRMFRNVGGIARHAAVPHSAWEVQGEGRALDGENYVIDHLALLHDREAREAKVARAYRHGDHDGATCEEYYLYEDYLDDLDMVRLPGDLPETPLPPGPRAVGALRSPVEHVALSTLLDHVAERMDAPPIWAAEYLGHTTPPRLGTNRGYTVDLRVRNSSRATWRSLGQVEGRVLVSYRWFDEAGACVVPQGDISILPSALSPGAETTVRAGLWTPQEPGRYRCAWDMLCERVAWFSDHGVQPLEVWVEVEDIGVRPPAPHFARAARPAPLPA